MTSRPADAPTYDELAARLAAAEAALDAVAAGAVDAVASGHGAGAEMVGLERADSFFVTLVTEMQEAAASLDANGTLLYANPRFAELLALPLSQVLGRTLAELTATSARAAARRLLAEAARGPARGTLELLRGDGRLVPVSVSAAPISGERPEVCLVATDLTERRRAEITLREAEERFRSAFEQAPIGMALLSLDGRFERVNAVLAAITGRPEAQLLGTPLASLLAGPDAAALKSRLAELQSDEQDSTGVDVRYLDAAGRGVWVAESAAVIRDADGRAQQILLQVKDVGERRRHQQQLERSEHRTRQILEAAHDAYVAMDADGCITDWNRQAHAVFGWSREEALGRELAAVIVPEDSREAHRRGLRRFLQTGEGPVLGRLIELTAVHRDGHVFPIELTISASVATEDGCSFNAFVRDISERKASEDLLERQRRQLVEAQSVGGFGSWEWDVTSGTIEWSDELSRIYGVEAGARRSFEECLALAHPDDRARLRVAVRTRGEFVEEYRIEHPTLGTRTLLIHGDVIEADPDTGRPARLAGTCQDVTEERAARSALQAAEERFRCSFDEAPIGMLIIGLDSRYERVNTAFCEIVGYTHEQLVGLLRESITHPDDVAADVAALRALRAGEATSYMCEKRYLHASGHAVWAAIGLTLIRDGGGQPLHFIGQVQDITDRRSYERQLHHMADHDPLTGLLNRRSFERELHGHAARIERYGATGAVLMLDLDNFKYFNDTQGHGAGDKLIVRIAQGLQSRLRDSDVLARLGGDEFAVLLPREDERETHAVAEALLALVRDETMPLLIGERKRVTASIGIARFDDGERLTAEEMMVNADLAMYDAKEDGRDRWAPYRTEQHDRPRIESRMKWAEQIDHAVAHEGFELLAQPIVPLAANGPAQYELLLRMRDRHGDLIPPASFLYVAERLGLIGEIDHWVAGRAIDMLAEQRAAGRDLRFEVNLSGHTIGDEGLLELIERRLRETGVPPDRLIFEITETAAVAHIGRAAAFAERLSELGCKFALDDFGAGFGSFYYLKHLPFDYLKIDGEFVRHCAANETDRILIAAVVQIARGMGKRTIAEYVTSQETAEVLTRLGVDYGQGFHLGRPAPLPEHLASANVPTHQGAGS